MDHLGWWCFVLTLLAHRTCFGDDAPPAATAGVWGEPPKRAVLRRLLRTPVHAVAGQRGESVAAAQEVSGLSNTDEREESKLEEPSSSIPKDFARIEADNDRLEREGLKTPYTSQAELNNLLRMFKAVWKPTYRYLPPVPLDGGPLAVGVRIELVKFQDLDEVAGTVNLVLDLMLCWADDRLSFNAEEVFQRSGSGYGNRLPITSDLVWTPDIVILNQVSDIEGMFAFDDSPLVVADDAFRKQTGVNVLWTRRINMNSRCSVDMSHFPFDMQTCSIIIGSWASSRRQMLLVPQDSQKYEVPKDCEGAACNTTGSIHTSEFLVKNVSVRKQDVYMRNAAERFEEIQYDLVFQRYPHYWMVNFMLPMFAVTMLTIATMWMTNAGTRMNSGTRLLLCIVQVMNITASWRPANEADIWLDRFQSHCLALSMGAVTQSLIIDYLLKTGLFELPWAPRSHVVDTLLRTVICFLAMVVFVKDLCDLQQRNDMGGVYSSFHAHSSKLLVAFIYVIFMCLGASSIFSTLWLVLPQELWKRMCCKSCTSVASGIPIASPESLKSSTSKRSKGADGDES